MDARARRSARYASSRREWTLYWPDRNSRLHRYDLVQPTPDIANLLNEIERDPMSIFFG